MNWKLRNRIVKIKENIKKENTLKDNNLKRRKIFLKKWKKINEIHQLIDTITNESIKLCTYIIKL